MGMLVAALLVVLDIIPAFNPTVVPRPEVLRSPLFTIHVVVAALRLRELRAGVRDRRHLRAAVQGDQGQAPRLLLRPAAVAAGAGRDERRAVLTIGWLFLTIGLVVGGIWADAGAQLAGSARPGDVGGGPEDSRRAAVVGRLFVRAVRARGRSAGAAGAPPGCRRSPSRSCSSTSCRSAIS